MKNILRFKWALVSVWLACWIYNTRYAMLDDALIHLRYAGFLQQVHHITYDGVHDSYGTSSLLYVSLLAALRSFTSTVFLSKIVSCVFYILLIGVLLLFERRFSRDGPPYAIWLGLLLTTLSPMGIRWLTDGMETSMVLFTVSLLAFAASRETSRTTATPLSSLAFGIFGALMVLLRIELASLAILTTCTLLAALLLRDGRASLKRHLALNAIALSFGAVLALVGTRLVFGSFLPDTALAKSSGPSLAPIGGIVHVILSSMLLGISSTLLSLLSSFLLLRELVRQRASRASYLVWACANASLPLVVILACLRGQAIQGIRYILWPIFFCTLWNAFEWERLRNEETIVADPRAGLIESIYRPYLGFLLLLLVFDWRFALRAMHGRANTFQTMRAAGLEKFKNSTLIAGDVGFIGYFTGANVCDMDGLVNGRVAAISKKGERIAACVAQHPQSLFLTDGQAREVSERVNLGGWLVCREFDFVNVGGNDRHYLMVPNSADARPCPGSESPLGSADHFIQGLVD